MKDLYIEDIPKGVSISDYITALERGYKLKRREETKLPSLVDAIKKQQPYNPFNPRLSPVY